MRPKGLILRCQVDVLVDVLVDVQGDVQVEILGLEYLQGSRMSVIE